MLRTNTHIYGKLCSNLEVNWTQYHQCLSACCQNPKRGSVHHLRTSIRRLISLLDLVQELHFSKNSKKLRTRLKKVLSSLRDLRDLQNQEKTLQSKILPKNKTDSLKSSMLMDFRSALKRNLNLEKKKVKTYLNTININKQEVATQSLKDYLLTQANHADSEKRVQNHLKKILASRYMAFKTCARQAHPDSPETLHKTRIQFKKFRYTWEIFKTFYKNFNSRQEKIEAKLKEVQNLLGQIQDTTVLIQFIIEFLVEEKISHPDSEIFVFLRSVEKKQEESISQFFRSRKQSVLQFHPNLKWTQKMAA